MLLCKIILFFLQIEYDYYYINICEDRESYFYIKLMWEYYNLLIVYLYGKLTKCFNNSQAHTIYELAEVADFI